MTLIERAATVAVGAIIDRFVSEPSNQWHPVAWLGSALITLERVLYRDSRTAGVAYMGAASITVVAATTIVDRLANQLGVRGLTTAASTLVASGGNQLGTTARLIHTALTDGDVEKARRLLPHLVGRDPTNLSESELARAVIESVAENTVDAATATVFWGVTAGGPGIWWHRLINTADAMVGHRNPRYRKFGWACARTDDAAAWLPARLTVGAIALAAQTLPECNASFGQIVTTAFTDGRYHPSPNAGITEAAFAAALGVQLGGTNRYDNRIEHRPLLGDGTSPTTDDIERAARLADRTTTLWVASVALLATVANLRKIGPQLRHKG